MDMVLLQVEEGEEMFCKFKYVLIFNLRAVNTKSLHFF